MRRRLHNYGSVSRKTTFVYLLMAGRAVLDYTEGKSPLFKLPNYSDLYIDVSRFTLESDSDCELIWREQDIRITYSNVMEINNTRKKSWFWMQFICMVSQNSTALTEKF